MNRFYRINALLLLLLLLLSACALVPSATPETSGVEGRVLIGPMCPVVQAGTECPDLPYQAGLIILKPDGREVQRFETDEQGRFSIPLPPGDYILAPQSKDAMPFASEVNFTVAPGEYTRLTFYFDSGIR